MLHAEPPWAGRGRTRRRAEMVVHVRQRAGDHQAQRALAVTDDARHRHAGSLARLAQQGLQVSGGGREQRPGQHDLPGQALAHDPQHLMADIGLEPSMASTAQPCPAMRPRRRSGRVAAIATSSS